MILNTKHFEILKELKKEDDLKRIATIFNQTERNIRYKIAELNSNLGEEKIFIKKRKIYCMLSKEDIDSLLCHIDKCNYIYNQEERTNLLVMETILQKDKFSLEEVEELLQISKSTLRADIKIWKLKLAKMGISLQKHRKEVYSFSYKNVDLIYYIAIFLYQYIVFDCLNDKIKFKKSNFFEKSLSVKLSTIYLKTLKKVYKQVRQMDLPYIDETLNLLILLVCALKVRGSDIDDFVVLNKKILKETKEFKLLSDTFSELSEEKIYFLTDYLIRISCDEKGIFLRHKNWIEIEVNVYRLIKEFEELKKVKLIKSKKLIDDVLMYIKPLLYRSSKGIFLKNSVLDEVKVVYGDTFKCLKQAFKHFSKKMSLEISDDEIGFLVPIFEIALKNRIEEPKNVVVISSYKRNLVNFMVARLKEEFLIDKIEVVPLKNADTINDSKIDLIITTEDLGKKRFKKPICKITPVLSSKDFKTLEKYQLSYRRKKIFLEDLMSVIENNVQEKSFNKEQLKEEIMYKFSTNIVSKEQRYIKNHFTIPEELRIEVDTFEWKEALKIGVQVLVDKEYVKKKYADSFNNKRDDEMLFFFLNEETVLFYTEPKDNILKSGFSLVVVNDSIVFKNKLIKNIICFSAKGNSEDRNLLFGLNDYFKDRLK